MTDQKRPTPAEDPSFDDIIRGDRALEQGLGLGERELKAQRDPGGVRTANEETNVEGGVTDAGDEDVRTVPGAEPPAPNHDV